MLSLEKIKYTDLNAKQKEIYNFQKVSALLADYGFNCIKLADDWAGADFLAYHKDGNSTLKVQLKGRLTVDKKYVGKEIFITFPYKGVWYMVEHDKLVDIVAESTVWLKSDSWTVRGGYSSGSPNKKMMPLLESYKL